MFRKIALAYNESPEAQRALSSAIQLAKSLNAELLAVTVLPSLPGYTAYARAVDASLSQVLVNDQVNFYEALQEKARALAHQYDIDLACHLIEGSEVEAIVSFVRHQKADLLVIGLHQRDLYVARLWSTVYEMAQEAPCSVLGVH
jgi:nucleotide-binding universal stress UspA family protein